MTCYVMITVLRNYASIVSFFVTDTLGIFLSSLNPMEKRRWFKSLSLSFSKLSSILRLYASSWSVVHELVSACMMGEDGLWVRKMSHGFTLGAFMNDFGPIHSFIISMQSLPMSVLPSSVRRSTSGGIPCTKPPMYSVCCLSTSDGRPMPLYLMGRQR